MTTQVDADGFAPQEWTYAGRVRLSKDRLGHRWLAPDAREFLVDKDGAPAHAVVGGIYTVMVSPDGTKARTPSAEYTRRMVDDEPGNQLRLESRAQQTEHDAKRLAAKHAKESTEIGELTLDEVRKMMRGRRGSALRTALLSNVMEYVSG
jgi:hypothetical protein